jgi:uroporphyrin-III C-methyltransferase
MSWPAEVHGRLVDIVNPGTESLGTVAALRVEGALVRLVATDLPDALADLADRGLVEWLQTADAIDHADAWLVLRPDAGGARAVPTPEGGPTAALAGDARPGAIPGTGRVILVGGGPGDPGLLTLRGRDELAAAQVVVVDRLAPLAHLDALGADVEVVDVSKIPHGRSTAQVDINAILVARARDGKRVVRLKGGDGFVFGRGMEEVLACQAAGVPVEVVPGVTSATSVPALAGIPVTHRGLSHGFSVVSGHVAPSSEGSSVDWAALARSRTTIVVLMGVGTIQAIAAELGAGGLAADTPVAFVVDGGLPGQRRLDSTLGEVADHGAPAGIRPPAVVVVGAVVDLTAEVFTDR